MDKFLVSGLSEGGETSHIIDKFSTVNEMNHKPDNDNLVPLRLWTRTGKKLEEVKKKLRAKVPKLTQFDVRIKRLPYYEAIIQDLYENGFRRSAEFIEELIHFEEEYKMEDEQFLKTQAGKQCLSTIAEYLKKAEVQAFENEKVNAVETVLYLAELLIQLPRQLWIIERIYMTAIDITKIYRLDGGLLEARVRYSCGRFLMEKCRLYSAAYETLKIAHQMSVAKEWTITSGVGVGKDLCKEVNYLLFMCLSNMEMKQNHTAALESSKKALRHALTSENKSIIPRAYLERGDREMDIKNYLAAVNFYTKGITFGQVSNQYEFICEGYLKKGHALQKLGESSRATSYANLAKRAAEDSSNKYYLAKSYMLFGEIAVSRAYMNIAGYNFMLAIRLFAELKEEKCAWEARFQGAYAMGHYVLEQLVELIRKVDKTGSQVCFKKLIKWKERLIPFWDSDNQCVLKKISDGSERNSSNLLAKWMSMDTFAAADNTDYSMCPKLEFHKHLFEEIRRWRTSY